MKPTRLVVLLFCALGGILAIVLIHSGLTKSPPLSRTVSQSEDIHRQLPNKSIPFSVKPLSSLKPIYSAHKGSLDTEFELRAKLLVGKIRDLINRPPSNSSPRKLRAIDAHGASNLNEGLYRSVRLNERQRSALRQLRWHKGQQLVVRARKEDNSIMYLKGRNLQEPVAANGSGLPADEVTSRIFLRRAGDLLLLENPDNELRLVRKVRDNLGYTQLRYEQSYSELPLWPAQLNVQIDRYGRVNLLTGGYSPTPIGINVEPDIDNRTAISVASALIEAGLRQQVVDASLIIFAPVNMPPHLAYKIEIHTSPVQHWISIVSAEDGRILAFYNAVCTNAVVGSGIDLNGENQALHLWFEDDLYHMVDTSKPMFDPILSDPPDHGTVVGGILLFDADDQDSKTKWVATAVTSANQNSEFNSHAVSAATNLSTVYDYYFDRHGRNSIDGRGGSILAFVNLPIDNAFWNGSLMLFGNRQDYAQSLDIVAHESTHGVITHSANLIYLNQSGALNEAFADIFGETIEAFENGSGPDWLHGTELDRPSRDFETPSDIKSADGRPYPTIMSEFIPERDPFLDNFRNRDNGGVHFNSTIITHAFYLLAEGLNGAIGINQAEEIFYRALTTKLTIRSQFIDCRLACVQSAEELYGAGSTQALRTAEAFSAVEIFDQAGSPLPVPIPSFSGEDATLFTLFDSERSATFLARREISLGDPEEGVFLSEIPIAPSNRPSLMDNGLLGVFVSEENDACIFNTFPARAACLGFAGQVSSVAISGDGRFFSFVSLDDSGEPINLIAIGETLTLAETGSVEESIEIFELRAPVLDGDTTDTILFAGAMDFSLDGRFLFFDALNRINFDDESFIDSWSIYMLDRRSGDIFAITPPKTEFETFWPAIGQRHNNLLTFELLDVSTGISTVLAVDLFTGRINDLVELPGIYPGFPSYNGDDTALVYTDTFVDQESSNEIPIIKLLPLQDDGITAAGAASNWLSGAPLAVIYRRENTSTLPVLNTEVIDDIAIEGTTEFAVFGVNKTGAFGEDLPFSFVLTGTANNGVDYETVPLTGVIPKGFDNVNVIIKAKNDFVAEFDETVKLSLTSAVHYILGEPYSATAVIQDQASNAEGPLIVSSAETQTISPGQSVTISFSATGTVPLAYQWYEGLTGDTSNPINGATSASFTTPPLNQTTDYWLRVSDSNGSNDSGTVSIIIPDAMGPSPLLIAGSADFVNDGTEFQGNVYNGFEINSRVSTFSSDPGTITRISFLDPAGDLMFAEFGSADPSTTLTISLENYLAAVPSPYNQPATTYARGLPTFTIENATSLTFFSAFTLGNDISRVDVALINSQTFSGDVNGIADIRLIRVDSEEGETTKIGGINAANANFIASEGIIGIDAPDVIVELFLFIGDITPSGTTLPVIRISPDSLVPEIQINGGDLSEAIEAFQIDTNDEIYPFPFAATDGQRSISDSPLRPDIGDGRLQPVLDTLFEDTDSFFETDGQNVISIVPED